MNKDELLTRSIPKPDVVVRVSKSDVSLYPVLKLDALPAKRVYAFMMKKLPLRSLQLTLVQSSTSWALSSIKLPSSTVLSRSCCFIDVFLGSAWPFCPSPAFMTALVQPLSMLVWLPTPRSCCHALLVSSPIVVLLMCFLSAFSLNLT